MSGRVVHFEIPYDDAARAERFYGEAFGWRIAAIPEMRYTAVTTGPSDQGPPSEPGFINGGMLRREGPLTAPVVTIGVEDIDAALEQVEALGGKTVQPRTSAGDVGWSAYFTDTEGNLMGLWQNA